MEFLSKNLGYLLAGISAGGQYALIAIGYTMVYGILRLINFAHGDVFMVAGLMMVYLSASLPLPIAIPLMRPKPRPIAPASAETSPSLATTIGTLPISAAARS